MNVLLVEDEPIPARYLKKVLEEAGHKVVKSVSSGADAIKASKETDIEVVLMDIMLEDKISGCEAALHICQNNPSMIIIFLTAYSDNEMIDYAMESKAFGYLLKPYREKEILATLSLAAVHLKKKNQPVLNVSSSLLLTGKYRYNIETKEFSHPTKKIELGPKALQLIHLLCVHRHQILTAEMIASFENCTLSVPAIRSLVYRIREATIPELIVNEHKTGYKIVLDTSVES